MVALTRRSILGGIIASCLSSVSFFARAEQHGIAFGPRRPFSFEWLKAQARALSQSAYLPPPSPVPGLLAGINFDVAQKIKFRSEDALWRDGAYPMPVEFFHLGKYNLKPVKIHAVEAGEAREIAYSPSYFDYADTGLQDRLPANLGFGGFRVLKDQTARTDWLAFQGASYFRASGSDDQYGGSARGIAINTGLTIEEEFPAFTNFWIEERAGKNSPVTIYALLDGPSVTGSYSMEASRNGGASVRVHADIFMRAPVQRLCLAPLTSMYWYSETNHRHGDDWRPEIHDSDGLALWTGRGERIWRPLNDTISVQTNSFLDENPKGFGLMQRDRAFDHYQDDGAYYDRRPSMWVESLSSWGKGAVQLIEIPTHDEIHDNIVAYWAPSAPAVKGATYTLDYRVYWQDPEPFPPALAHVIATRIGRGGVPGSPPVPGLSKFVIDFEGAGPLAEMRRRYDIKPTVTVSRGQVSGAYVTEVVGTHIWRAVFDLAVTGRQPVDMRCHLRLGDRELTETWLYQFFPG